MLKQIRTHQIIAHLAAMAVVILGAVFVAKLPSTAHAEVDNTSPLAVTIRTSLEVCAQVSSSLKGKQAQILNQLSKRMETLKNTHPEWNTVYGSDTPAPQFHSNCTVKIPTSQLDPGDMNAVGRGIITDPSSFRAVVLVLDDQMADTVLGPLDISHAVYEVMQVSEHEYVEVTNALVVRESFIGNPDFVDQYLSVAVSLNPRRPYEPPTGEVSPVVKPAEVSN
jgi:hypothetical protein